MRSRFVHLLCIAVMLPLLPFYVLKLFAGWLSDACDWCVEGRAWCQPFVKAGDWIEGRLLYSWPGPGPEPKVWTAFDGTRVYRSYEDYCD